MRASTKPVTEPEISYFSTAEFDGASAPSSSRWRAFTLIELLVVVSIIAILIAILLPSLNKARRSARDVACMSNLKQIGNAVSLYVNENHGRLPWASFDATPSNAATLTSNAAIGASYQNKYTPGRILWRYQISRYLGIKINPAYDVPDLYMDPALPLARGVFACPLSTIDLSAAGSQFRKGEGGYGWNYLYLGLAYKTIQSGTYQLAKGNDAPMKAAQVKRSAETILAGDAQDVGNEASTSGIDNFASMIPPTKEVLIAATPAGGQPAEISRRHFSHSDPGDYTRGGPNILWADFHVDNMPRTQLIKGLTGNIDWYYLRK